MPSNLDRYYPCYGQMWAPDFPRQSEDWESVPQCPRCDRTECRFNPNYDVDEYRKLRKLKGLDDEDPIKW